MKEFSNLLRSLNGNEIDVLYRNLASKAQEKLKENGLKDYFTWVKAIWTNAKGKPLVFKDRPYLVDIYCDQYPSIVYIKSSQMGLSERAISEAIWIADQLTMNSLYTFPAQTQLADFVKARVNPVLEHSEYLKAKAEASEKRQRLALKRIGDGYIYFRGSQNEKQIITIDADCVYLDERDRFGADSVPYIDKRLSASTLRWRREISTPTFPDWGIHRAYLKSDQRIWQVKCKHCGHWQEIDFFKNVDFRKAVVRCRMKKCRKPLDRIGPGKWFATNPASKIHGYKINGMYNPTIDVRGIISRYREAQNSGFSALQQFFNQDLGLPYEVEGQSVRLEELENCKKDYLLPIDTNKSCFAGIDIGVDYHHAVVVQRAGEKQYRIVWAGRLNKFEGPSNSIQQLIEKYKPQVVVVDKRPETTKVSELIKMFPAKIYAVTYPRMEFSVKDYCRWDDVKREVRLDRTISLDYLMGDIQNQTIQLPKNINNVPHFFDQMTSSVRIVEKNKRSGRDVSRWINKSDDHYFHALNFARIAVIKGGKGKALLDYYKEPTETLSPGLVDWIRINSKKIF